MAQKHDIDFDNPDIKNQFDRIAKVQKAFVREVSEYSEQIKDEEKSYDAYFSDSWDTEVAQKRREKGLPMSDVARFASIVDTISGNERQTRSDVQVFPFERDDQLTADVANNYLKYRNRKESQWHEDSLSFIDALVSQRAHNEYYLRNNPKDGSLETVRMRRPSSEVYVQKPYRDITAKDSPGTIHAQWVYIDDLKRQFKNKILNPALLDHTPQERKPKLEITHLLDSYDFADKKEGKLFFKSDGDRQMVRVIRWWRRYKKNIFRVLNPSPTSFDDILVATVDTRKEALTRAVEFLGANNGIAETILKDNIVQAEGKRILMPTTENIDLIADNMIEEQIKDVYAFHMISGRVELAYNNEWGDFLPWTHLFCYFVDGKPGGIYDRIKDLIQEDNFIHSKLMERLGRIGKMPLLKEEGATNMSDDALQEAFEDGGVITVADNSNRNRRVMVMEDTTLSSIPPYIALEESINNTMKELTGANDPLQGRSPGANTAGVAIELLQRRGSALIAPVQDNFKRFKMENARMEINMLLRAYDLRPNWTAMKLARIVGGMVDTTQEPGIGQDGQITNLAGLIQAAEAANGGDKESGRVLLMNRILKAMSGMEYDFVMDETVYSPTIRMAVLQTLANIARVLAIPIDPAVIIEMTELPQKVKDRLLGFSQSNQGQFQVQSRQASGGMNENGSLPNLENIAR